MRKLAMLTGMAAAVSLIAQSEMTPRPVRRRRYKKPKPERKGRETKNYILKGLRP